MHSMTHEGRFRVEQYVTHAHQYEPMPEGNFDTAEAAIAGMRDVAENCGFTGMRVWDELEREVIATSEAPE